MNPELVGYAAGALATFSLAPQIIKAWRTKETKDISLWMYVLFCVGVGLWLLYGILIRSSAIIVANIVTLGLTLIVLVLKLRYG